MYHLHTFSCTYFYSHPREGGDVMECASMVCLLKFLFTPPRRGRLTGITDAPFGFDFYSRPREGGDSTLL